MKENNYCVYTLRVATALVDRGFEVKGTAIDFNNPKYKVFLFENTEELRKALWEITHKEK